MGLSQTVTLHLQLQHMYIHRGCTTSAAYTTYLSNGCASSCCNLQSRYLRNHWYGIAVGVLNSSSLVCCSLIRKYCTGLAEDMLHARREKSHSCLLLRTSLHCMTHRMSFKGKHYRLLMG